MISGLLLDLIRHFINMFTQVTRITRPLASVRSNPATCNRRRADEGGAEIKKQTRLNRWTGAILNEQLIQTVHAVFCLSKSSSALGREASAKPDFFWIFKFETMNKQKTTGSIDIQETNQKGSKNQNHQ